MSYSRYYAYHYCYCYCYCYYYYSIDRLAAVETDFHFGGACMRGCACVHMRKHECANACAHASLHAHDTCFY